MQPQEVGLAQPIAAELHPPFSSFWYSILAGHEHIRVVRLFSGADSRVGWCGKGAEWHGTQKQRVEL